VPHPEPREGQTSGMAPHQDGEAHPLLEPVDRPEELQGRTEDNRAIPLLPFFLTVLVVQVSDLLARGRSRSASSSRAAWPTSSSPP